MLFPKGYRQLRSIEETLNNIKNQGFLEGTRQTLFVRRLDENIKLSYRLFYYKHLCLILDSNSIHKYLEGYSFGEKLSQKDRKKLLSDSRDISTITQSRVLQFLQKCKNLEVPLDRVVGTEICGLRFHFINESEKFIHCLGLSDAIDLSMTMSQTSVKFPSLRKSTTYDYRKIPARKRSLIKESGKYTFVCGRQTTKHRRFHLLLHYLRVFPSNLADKDYVKLIKTSLSHLFSWKLGQELPEGSTIPIFPIEVQLKLDNLFRSHKDRCAQFYFNLLQSKALCAPVGKDMIKEAYVKHRDSLCRPVEECVNVPQDYLDKLEKYGEKIGKRMLKYYNPFKTSLPNFRACFEQGRPDGGNLKQLEREKNLCFIRGNPLTSIDDTCRVEPYVIGLFGPPGSGKTTLTQSLIRFLGNVLFSDLSGRELSYARSCSTKHWDGYHGQPIVVLDDFGQNHSDRTDLVEFENLVSVNEYIVPMASLNEKGTRFQSPIIILTSNCQFGSDLYTNQCSSVEEPMAVWRRITLPLYLQKGEAIRQYDQEMLGTLRSMKSKWKEKYESFKSYGLSLQPHDQVFRRNSFLEKAKPFATNHEQVGNYVVKEISQRYDFHQRNIRGVWSQIISRKRIRSERSNRLFEYDVSVTDTELQTCDFDYSLELQFPDCPPAHPPRVKAIALSEPLKVRMITAAEAETKALQPFQKALWQCLSEDPQFCLTDGVKILESFDEETLPWIYRIEKVIQSIDQYSDPNNKWLSGDYTAATDNFPMSVTQALKRGILKSIQHEPTRRYLEWELSPHQIVYPELGEFSQTSGQLMGSLVSFPFLCFHNDCLMEYCGFDKHSYLINGDDVVAKGPDSCIEKWKSMAPQVGLSLSMGKNFIDPDFCTINSQLFYRGNVLHTGKASCQTRVGTTLGYCFEETQFYWGTEDWVHYEFLKRNLMELKKTPRSLLVGKKRGGLALVDVTDRTKIKFDPSLHKNVYLLDLLRPFWKAIAIPGTEFDAIPIPVIRGKESKKLEGDLWGHKTLNEQLQPFLKAFEVPKDEVTGDLSHKELREFSSRCSSSDRRPYFRDLVHKILHEGKFDLLQFPELDFLEVDYRFVKKNKANYLLECSRIAALELMIQHISKDICPVEYIGGSLGDFPGWKEYQDEFDLLFGEEGTKSLTLSPDQIITDEITEDFCDWFENLNVVSSSLKFGKEYSIPNSQTGFFSDKLPIFWGVNDENDTDLDILSDNDF